MCPVVRRMIACAGLLVFAHVSAPPVRAQQISHIVPVPATNLIYDPVSRKIYATVGASDRGEMTNSITVVDPVSGQVGRSVFVGSGPGAMTLSDKSKYLYVAVSDGMSVRRVDLATMTAGPQYPITGKPVRHLLPLPGEPEGFIAHRGNHARYDDALTIYVSGQIRGKEATCAPSLAVGIAPTRLFTYQSMLSSWDFDGYDVGAEGVTHVRHNQTLMSGYIGLSGGLNGLILSSGGAVIDPEIPQIVGRLDFKGKAGAIMPDPRRGLALCLAEGDRGQLLAVCNVRNFQYLGAVPLNSGIKGSATSAVLWGEDGLAYTVGGQLVLVQVPRGPLLPPADLALQRSAIPRTLPPGNELKYRLTVTNAGTSPASGVFLSDALPPATEVLATTASQGHATAADGTVRAELGALATGASATVDVTLRFREVRDVRFTAVARAFEPDPKPENNVARYVPDGPISPLPDLTGAWVGLRQVAVGAGVDLQAGIQGRFTVRNDGKRLSHPVRLRYYLSVGPRFDVRVSPLLQEVPVPALRPGQQFISNLEALLGVGDDVTGLFIFAVLDADDTLEESTKSNNTVGQRVP